MQWQIFTENYFTEIKKVVCDLICKSWTKSNYIKSFSKQSDLFTKVIGLILYKFRKRIFEIAFLNNAFLSYIKLHVMLSKKFSLRKLFLCNSSDDARKKK